MKAHPLAAQELARARARLDVLDSMVAAELAVEPAPAPFHNTKGAWRAYPALTGWDCRTLRIVLHFLAPFPLGAFMVYDIGVGWAGSEVRLLDNVEVSRPRYVQADALGGSRHTFDAMVGIPAGVRLAFRWARWSDTPAPLPPPFLFQLVQFTEKPPT